MTKAKAQMLLDTLILEDKVEGDMAKAVIMAIKALEEPTLTTAGEGEWTTHEVACLLAEVVGDDCACNVNGNDEWLPSVCEYGDTSCPNVVGGTCWEQWLIHKKEKADD